MRLTQLTEAARYYYEWIVLENKEPPADPSKPQLPGEIILARQLSQSGLPIYPGGLMNQPGLTIMVFNILDAVKREVEVEKAAFANLRENTSGTSGPNFSN